MEQKSTQDYLKAVYGLSKNGDLVSTTEISHQLNVAPASVTEMLKKLSEDGYVKYSPYHGGNLNREGLQEAQRLRESTGYLRDFSLMSCILAKIKCMWKLAKWSMHYQMKQKSHYAVS
jgi:DtxR family Mn-dependent transcriptional regulator